MTELLILAFIAFVAGYCAILWFSARKGDVIHGGFVDHQP